MAQSLILWLLCAVEVCVHPVLSSLNTNTICLQAARILHQKMAIAIFRSPMSFFDTTPAGRILNRFSSDV